MQSLRYLIFLVLFTIVVHSDTTNEAKHSDIEDSKLDLVKSAKDSSKDTAAVKNKNQVEDEDVDDDPAALSSYADARYSAFDSPSPISQTREHSSLPPASFDNTMNSNDWSRLLYENVKPTSVPSLSFDSGAVFGNRPTCYSLVDNNYPVFADICGAVPQARYSLPNSFGHRDRWQITQFLHGFVSSSSDSTCTRSLRLLICPILFPPCPSGYQTPAVLPCQPFCRAVKARCSNIALGFLSCESLPYTSDLCPTSQAYGSLVSPGSFASRAQGLSLTGASFPSPKKFSYFPPGLSAQNLLSPMFASPVNRFHGGHYRTDNLTPNPVDLSSRLLANGNQPAGRYTPSLTEPRPALETQLSAVKV